MQEKYGEIMNCKQCEKLIDDYINNSLDESFMDEFISHIEKCDSCRDELVVNYSLLTALKQLDTGEEMSSDYEGEVINKIVNYKEKKRNAFKRRIYAYILAFIFSFIIAIVAMIIGHPESLEYSKNSSDTHIQFNYDGVADEYDFVNQTIDKYNYKIIEYLHSR
jgi:hypothetical protein